MLNPGLGFLDRKRHVFGFSDASGSGFRGADISLERQHVCHKLWDSSEASKSSTWRELAAIDFAIESFNSVLESSHVKWYTDNQAAAKIVDVGSMKPDLHKLAVKIFGACLRSKIKLEVQWIPRSENDIPLLGYENEYYLKRKNVSEPPFRNSARRDFRL